MSRRENWEAKRDFCVGPILLAILGHTVTQHKVPALGENQSTFPQEGRVTLSTWQGFLVCGVPHSPYPLSLPTAQGWASLVEKKESLGGPEDLIQASLPNT